MNEEYNKLKYFEETEKILKDVYYHYTSLDALYSIVKSHTFRLMSLRSSNDRTELFYKPETFISDVSRLCDAEEDQKIKEYYNLMKISCEAHKESLLKDLKAPKHPYALCLSKKKDNLTHWDRYASSCTGVAIGFNVKALEVLYRRMGTSGFALGLFDLGKTLYTSDSIDSWIKYEMLRSFKWLMYLSETTHEKDIRKITEQKGYMFMGSACRNVMKFAKASAFLDEDEFRIYFDPNNVKETLNLLKGGKGHTKGKTHINIQKNFLELVDSLHIGEEDFAMTKSGVRGYYNLCLDEIWGSGVVPEIILGPMCVQNKSELQRFLKSNGLEGTKITVSSVPIR